MDYKRAGLTDDIQELVTKTIRSPPINSDISKLSVIKERLPDHVSYGHIKLVIAILELSLGVATFSGSDYPPSQSSSTSSNRPVKTPWKPHPAPKENSAVVRVIFKRRLMVRVC